MDSRGKRENRLYLTNDYSIVSKYSAVKSNYYKDDILKTLIEAFLDVKTWRRTPLVNRGYAARLLAVDWIVRRSIQFDSVDCFIVLGAGYSTLPFNLADKGCCWIELDLPQVVNTKSKFIKDENLLIGQDLLQVDNGVYVSTSRNYILASCDLRDTDELGKLLKSLLVNIGKRRNVAIINEVCLCYLESNDVEKILEKVIVCVKDFAFRVHYIGYEQVKPESASQFSKVMLDHFDTLGHPLKHYPEADQIRHLLSDKLKFNHVTVASMYQIFHNALLGTTLETEAFQEEPFDEFEEMDLYLAHYALVTGVLILKDPFMSSYNRTGSDREEKDIDDIMSGLNLVSDEFEMSFIGSKVQRFGHTSCLFNDTNRDEWSIIVSGGFGLSIDESSPGVKQQHKRLSDCCILTEQEDGTFDFKPLCLNKFSSDTCLNRMHGQITQVPSTNILFFNGGRQSPARHKESNLPFLASLLNNQIVLNHRFDSKTVEPTLRWRHKLSGVICDQVIQVGGIDINSIDGDLKPLVMWNLSSSKLGFNYVRSLENSEIFDRHSFGMDMRDSNQLLVFGGLQAKSIFKDKPVDSESAATLWDIRSNLPNKLDLGLLTSCYGSQIHFISDNQFVRIGGISTLTGLELSAVDVIDLRNMKHHSIQMELMANQFTMLTNATTNHNPSEHKIVSIGGGGNYFTFGTCFNDTHLVYRYK